jgi:diguanylate cyclase (GGDEF)-like protein/PAS domain S-box-containing protein
MKANGIQPSDERPIRRQTFWLAALLILGSGLLLVASLIHERNQTMRNGLRTTESLALVIAEQTTRTVQTVDQRLQLAASGLTQLEAKQKLDEQSARQLLRQHLQELPFVRAIWVLDSRGRIQYDTDLGNIGTSLADRAYFQIYKNHPETVFSLGKPVRSRSTDTWLISASRPLVSEDGHFLGVIVAAIEPPYFDALWRQVDLGEGGSVALLHSQGDLVMRSPLEDAAMGKNFATSPLFRDHLPNAASGQFLDPSPVDGTERLFVYRSLSAQPDFVIIVGAARDWLMAPWRQYAFLAAGIWLCASALIALLCWLLARSWSKQDLVRREAAHMAKRLSLGTEAAGVAVWDWNITTDAWYVTPTYFTMLGYEVEGGVGNREQWMNRLHPEDREGVSSRIRSVLAGLSTPYEYEARLRHANGSWRWMRVVGRVLERGQDGKATRLMGVRIDITQHRQDVEEIRRLAYFDALTQLPNRASLTNRLRQAVVSSARTGHHGALMFLDLDHFKQINDTRGHDLGDLLLQQVAQRLQGCVRAGDSVARFGGDEFVVLLESLSQQEREAVTQAEVIANKIVQALGQPYILRDTSYVSTPSIGIVVFSKEPESTEELLKKADMAMYQAKSAGRNTARFFDPAMQAAATAYVELEADLRRGLASQEFVLHYQIQVDIYGKTTGAEALVRWEHPTRGLVPPAHFIEQAEETGVILILGQWVLRAACQQLAQWSEQDTTQSWTMAVNVSASQFAQDGFVANVAAALSESGASPNRLKLELTESMLVDDVNGVIEKMNQIKAMGVDFSLDDFGTGYSSLSYLKRLPLAQLKIDQSFVRDILSDTSDAVIARTIIALGQSLGLKVIAEGVETAEQLNFLIGLECEAFQGYYFGRPVPAPQLLS